MGSVLFIGVNVLLHAQTSVETKHGTSHARQVCDVNNFFVIVNSSELY